MSNKKIVYITGCLGFIGSYVTKACLDQGWYVKGIDKITYAARVDLLEEFNKNPRFNFEKLDICNIERLVDCDYFINVAAETHVDNSIRKSDDFIHSNIDGVYNILELLKIYKKEGYITPTLVHFSTDEVYGDVIEGEHIETDILKPSNPYSATKAAADQLIIAWGRTYDLPYVIVRPTNNYGVGQYVEKLIPKSCKFMQLGRKIPLHNNGTPVRNWLHAKDTADGIITIINNDAKNEIYNIAGGFEQSNIKTVEKIIKEYLGELPSDYKEKYLDFSVQRVGQDVRYALNDSKLRSLGWSPQCHFDIEIKPIVEFYKHNFVW
jgi:dTDP-glucose 4,6-dehydratase